MTEALAIRQPEWESKIELVKRVCAPGASDDELQLFFHQARRTGLDPLAKQIYCVKRAGKMAIQTGIDGYRLIADRTGQYAGNDDYEFDDATKQPAWAKARVWKLVGGVRCPFEATARWEQYFPGEAQGFMWKKMPHVMLGKCAEALALRKAFPAELSGVYTADEMEQSGVIDAPSRHEAKILEQSATIAPSHVSASSSITVEPLADMFPPENHDSEPALFVDGMVLEDTEKKGRTGIRVVWQDGSRKRDEWFGTFSKSFGAALKGSVNKRVTFSYVRNEKGYYNITGKLIVDGVEIA